MKRVTNTPRVLATVLLLLSVAIALPALQTARAQVRHDQVTAEEARFRNEANDKMPKDLSALIVREQQTSRTQTVIIETAHPLSQELVGVIERHGGTVKHQFKNIQPESCGIC